MANQASSSQPPNLATTIAQQPLPAQPHQKRTKERTIQDIIEKVSLWRKLYNGVTDPEGNLLRYSLEDAASKVGVSKKSLDDYLLQLRFGKRFGFDFQKHKDDKVGVLRTFVKNEKSKEKTTGGANGKKGAGGVKGRKGRTTRDSDEEEDGEEAEDEQENEDDDIE